MYFIRRKKLNPEWCKVASLSTSWKGVEDYAPDKWEDIVAFSPSVPRK
jgi:hypothetical protein